MASQQQLKRRIGSVQSTRQITKAMEMVAASKMRRAQENAVRGREFRTLALELLTRLRETTDVSKHPLFQIRTPKARLHIAIASDRGLAGGYNANILKALTREVAQDQVDGLASYVMTIGRYVSKFVGKVEGLVSLGAYTDFAEQPTANDLQPILELAKRKFLDGEVDYIDIIFTDYKSSLLQTVTSERLLPAAFIDVPIAADLENAVFEPSAQAVLDNVTERFLEVQLYQAILESLASEHSSRMMAMKNASDNAGDIIEDLTLAFNTARQAAITQELAEITSGAEAIK